MSDLVERLREFNQDGLALATRVGNARWLLFGEVAKEAADEIDGLRHDLDTYMKIANDYLAEIERLNQILASEHRTLIKRTDEAQELRAQSAKAVQ